MWLKFGEPAPAKVKLAQDKLTVVQLFREVLSAQEPLQLVECPGPCMVAAAVAFAESKRWGIGGWLFLHTQPCILQTFFLLQFFAGDATVVLTKGRRTTAAHRCT